MGVCQSSASNLEYYDAWGHQVPTLVVAQRATRSSGCASVAAAPSAGNSTTLFQSYFKYVDMSPYVVLQDKTQQCDCVMCRGMTDASPPQRRWKGPQETNSLTDGSVTDDEPERPQSP
ncbi:hypothetical protein PHMEG_00019939 [Phytophthora megakarya]|uniref:Uncharacterized protein n=1 Tax=Phytophthora megakarya TaxID=4795 RepID=A0A225VQ97_9STRA|nr:hypothetical protein PHMEG_00019939 [Phytophthora megakarya]